MLKSQSNSAIFNLNIPSQLDEHKILKYKTFVEEHLAISQLCDLLVHCYYKTNYYKTHNSLLLFPSYLIFLHNTNIYKSTNLLYINTWTVTSCMFSRCHSTVSHVPCRLQQLICPTSDFHRVYNFPVGESRKHIETLL